MVGMGSTECFATKPELAILVFFMSPVFMQMSDIEPKGFQDGSADRSNNSGSL